MSGLIGARRRPLDWDAKTSGAARFVLDHLDELPQPPLWAAVHRSPHPLADLLAVETSVAQRMPGVHAVITAEDFGDKRYFAELPFADRRPLARERVRFRGEEIAAVAAETTHQALEAAHAIEVRYRRRRAPFTTATALRSRATALHDRTTGERNVSVRDRGEHGDFAGVLASAAVQASGTFRYPKVAQVPMEPSACIASWDPVAERLELWTTTQSPRIVAEVVAEMLDLDAGQVVCRESLVGGGFGARSRTCEYEVLTAMLSLRTGRPVVLAFTREDEFRTSRSRHAFETTMTGYATAEGDILGFDAQIVMDNGAYNLTGPFVMSVAVHALGSMYRPRGVRWDTRLVDTATVPGGQMRGLGYPQVALASESVVDLLAEQQGRDPLDYRIHNATVAGQRSLGGGEIRTSGLVDCLEEVRAAIDWDRRRADPTPLRGVGVAAGMHGAGDNGGRVDANRSAVALDVFDDGRVRIRFGASDFGTHQRTAVAQIVAQELGVALEAVDTLWVDTQQTPFELGQWGSRGTYFAGHAARQTATELADRIRQLARAKFGTDDIVVEQGMVRAGEETVSLGELVASADDFSGGCLSHESTYVDQIVTFDPEDPVVNDVSGTYSFAAHAAAVEVDPRTGKITVVDYVAAHDIGTAINPGGCEGQVIGGVVMGLGAVLGEELLHKEGRVLNPAYLNYAMPRGRDLPAVRPILVEGHRDNGPYGAKSVGELPTCLAAPAVLNAVYDATGIRFDSLPVTPDKVLAALAARDGRPSRRHRLWRRPDRWQIDLMRRAYPLGVHWVLDRFGRKVADRRQPVVVASVATPDTVQETLAELRPGSALMGGGTDLHLQRRQGISLATDLVSLRRVDALRHLTQLGDGGLEVGAAVTLQELLNSDLVPRVLADVIATIASEQVRNVATVGGNLVQAKRCWFYRNGFDCYKRAGVTAPCYAVTGDHRFYHAAMGAHRCQATTPSDVGSALVAFDAVLVLSGREGEREVEARGFYDGPGETVLREGELVRAIRLPPGARTRPAAFRKLALYSGDFAVSSVTIVLGEGGARTVVGGVAPTPWRARQTEAALDRGRPFDEVVQVFDAELTRHGHPLARNGWKLDASLGLLRHALDDLGAAYPELLNHHRGD